MLQYEGIHYDNIISEVMFHNCVTTISDWNQLSQAADTRSVHIYDNSYGQNSICHDKPSLECSALKHMFTFTFTNSNKTSPNLMNVLSCEAVYPEMGAVRFTNMHWTDLSTEFITLFPNLQSLELPQNKFTVPPKMFPWTDKELIFPKNISRSSFLSEYLDMPLNIHPRMLNLKYNNIKNLSAYIFHGCIHFISLEGNGMSTISSEVFQNTSCLQIIELGQNNFTNIPHDLFRKLTDLRKLDMRDNRLATLPMGLFKDLINIRYINLASNRLKMLPPGLLAELHELIDLHLENNVLSVLDAEVFPLESSTLTHLYFHNNPIVTLPDFIFWIRSLELADFHNTNITFENFEEFIKNMNRRKFLHSVAHWSKTWKRVINLSNCKITSLSVKGNLTHEMFDTLGRLLKYFNFELTNNPIICDCKLLPLLYILKSMKDIGALNTNYDPEWVCKTPQELQNRPLLSLNLEEFYCPAINLSDCPDQCQCYIRFINKNIIVDCRKAGLTNMHVHLPNGQLELWYSYNNITSLRPNPYFRLVKAIDISFNRVSRIYDKIFKDAQQLEILNVQSNLLTYLPKAIKDLNLEDIKLSQNHYLCDCKSLWMKHWVLQNKHVIKDWKELDCNNKAQGRKLIEVKDTEFVCEEPFDLLHDAIMSSIILCFLFALILFIYSYRLELKVLVFIYLRLHPFDRDNDNQDENIDCVVVYSETKSDWVMNNIVKFLERKCYRFVVCDMARDFIAGFSVQENLTHAVRHSKRILFCISKDWKTSNSSFQLAWRIANEKFKEKKLHYIIVIGVGLTKQEITDRQVQRFVKRGRFINSSKRLFIENVIYFMPRKKIVFNPGIRQNDEDIFQSNLYEMGSVPLPLIENQFPEATDSPGVSEVHAFISYADKEYAFPVHVLRPMLEAYGLKLCIPDRDFVPGASIEENILKAIDSSEHTILVLSNSLTIDEWLLFTFRRAFDKSLREKTNHLIVLRNDNVDEENLDLEIQQYLKSYVSINLNDTLYEQKLLKCLPSLNHSEERNTPLFLHLKGL